MNNTAPSYTPPLSASIDLGGPQPKHEITCPRLLQLVEQFCQNQVLVIGDVMLDRYLWGDAERISPEAPVPVVLVEKENFVLGGAGNVAQNIRAAGGASALVGTKGADQNGVLIDQALEQRGVQATLLPVTDRPTTVKLRIMARQQQMLRVDWENSQPLTSQDQSAVLQAVEQRLTQSKALIISDYSKGLVDEQFMQRLHALMREKNYAVPILVDPKPSNLEAYKGVTLLTPNTKETSELAHMPTHTSEQIVAAGHAIMHRLGCPYLVTTLGARGMAVFMGTEAVWHIPVTSQEVFDVTGAGDTVIGTLSLALASGANLLEAAVIANYAAAIVVAKVGAATASKQEIASAISQHGVPQLTRWV